MVGEVQAVIRDLAKTGKTLMIVTHEMAFAKAISNRVFFMDEGGIYEDGTPQQIFDDPQKENTRRFIRKLKVLEIVIESRDYDFLDAVSRIRQYCGKNQIDEKMAQYIQLAFEEMVNNQIVSVIRNPKVRTTVEFSAVDESATITVLYNGGSYDPLREGDKLSLAVLRSAVSELTYNMENDPVYGNKIEMKIKK